MADSKREQIIQALIGRLATITTANGYETGLGGKIARGLREVPKKDELPAIVLREGKWWVMHQYTMSGTLAWPMPVTLLKLVAYYPKEFIKDLSMHVTHPAFPALSG